MSFFVALCIGFWLAVILGVVGFVAYKRNKEKIAAKEKEFAEKLGNVVGKIGS